MSRAPLDRRRPGAIRAGLAGFGLILLVPMGLTVAAYSDEAALGLGSAGIGSEDRFDIGLVSQGSVLQADPPTGAPWTVTGASELVPGRTITTEVPVFNNTPRLLADTTLTVVARDGGVGGGVPDITPHLRFTATSADGGVLFEDAPLTDASGSIGALAARGSAALDAGASFVPGAAGSLETVTLSIEYLDEPGVEALNGGQAAISLRFDATSATP